MISNYQKIIVIGASCFGGFVGGICKRKYVFFTICLLLRIFWVRHEIFNGYCAVVDRKIDYGGKRDAISSIRS